VIVLLDSTVLIDVLRGRKERRALLAGLVGAGWTLATSAANSGAIYGGMRRGEEEMTDMLLRTLECYPVSCSIARHAGDLQREWSRKGLTLTLVDMMVAATALEFDAALMTDNRKDFPMEDLRFYPAL
jgi:predicted nucleic acid-binding protein